MTLSEIRTKVGVNKPFIFAYDVTRFIGIFLENGEMIWEYEFENKQLFKNIVSIFNVNADAENKYELIDYFDDSNSLIIDSEEKEKLLGPCTCTSFIGFGHQRECKWWRE